MLVLLRMHLVCEASISGQRKQHDLEVQQCMDDFLVFEGVGAVLKCH